MKAKNQETKIRAQLYSRRPDSRDHHAVKLLSLMVEIDWKVRIRGLIIANGLNQRWMLVKISKNSC